MRSQAFELGHSTTAGVDDVRQCQDQLFFEQFPRNEFGIAQGRAPKGDVNLARHQSSMQLRIVHRVKAEIDLWVIGAERLDDGG